MRSIALFGCATRSFQGWFESEKRDRLINRTFPFFYSNLYMADPRATCATWFWYNLGHKLKRSWFRYKFERYVSFRATLKGIFETKWNYVDFELKFLFYLKRRKKRKGFWAYNLCVVCDEDNRKERVRLSFVFSSQIIRVKTLFVLWILYFMIFINLMDSLSLHQIIYWNLSG